MSATTSLTEQREQLLRRAIGHQARAHQAYDRADGAQKRGDQVEARRLYAHGQALEAAADLYQAEAEEIGPPE